MGSTRHGSGKDYRTQRNNILTSGSISALNVCVNEIGVLAWQDQELKILHTKKGSPATKKLCCNPPTHPPKNLQ